MSYADWLGCDGNLLCTVASTVLCYTRDPCLGGDDDLHSSVVSGDGGSSLVTLYAPRSAGTCGHVIVQQTRSNQGLSIENRERDIYYQ